jgi:hypothetical protein
MTADHWPNPRLQRTRASLSPLSVFSAKARCHLVMVIFTLALLTLGCFSNQIAPSDRKGTAGGLQSLGPFRLSSVSLGQFTISPSSCTSGDRERFLGADFSDESAGVVVRLVVDPLDGPAVRVFASAAPFEKSVVFRRSECRVFHFSLESTGWRINGVQDYRVSLDLDCVSKGGDTLDGKVSASHCH